MKDSRFLITIFILFNKIICKLIITATTKIATSTWSKMTVLGLRSQCPLRKEALPFIGGKSPSLKKAACWLFYCLFFFFHKSIFEITVARQSKEALHYHENNIKSYFSFWN